ncbi:hypothetical protein [Bradyrhizobium sp. USDA 4353]
MSAANRRRAETGRATFALDEPSNDRVAGLLCDLKSLIPHH